MTGIIGKKLGMTQVFKEDGTLVPVTAVYAGPCTVVQIKTKEKDGYSALQVGFENRKVKHTKKPLQGHFKKANIAPKRVLYEFKAADSEIQSYKLGQEITVDSIFKQNDFIDVSGTSKGRGYTGVMKRHHFHGADAGHGTHEHYRHGGSISMSSTPGHVMKGKRMAGHSGNANVTVQNLRVVQIDKEKNILLIKGAIPGASGGYIIINKAVKKS